MQVLKRPGEPPSAYLKDLVGALRSVGLGNEIRTQAVGGEEESGAAELEKKLKENKTLHAVVLTILHSCIPLSSHRKCRKR